MIIRQEKAWNGSLLNLFKSEFFNVHMGVWYLFSHDNEGIIDYLMNEFYNEDIYFIDFYLP